MGEGEEEGCRGVGEGEEGCCGVGQEEGCRGVGEGEEEG